MASALQGHVDHNYRLALETERNRMFKVRTNNRDAILSAHSICLQQTMIETFDQSI